MDKKLLDIFACPVCMGRLTYKSDKNELICPIDRLAYPIRDGIHVLFEEEARSLAADEDVG